MINHRSYYDKICQTFEEVQDRYAEYSERKTLNNRLRLLSATREHQYYVRSLNSAVKNEICK